MSSPDEIRKIKEKLAKIEEEDKGMVEFNIRIVRFRNLSPWLKTIVIFSWVIAIYFFIFFSISFVVGLFSI